MIDSKVLNKRVLKDTGDGMMAKRRQFLYDAMSLKSCIREFETNERAVATCIQNKKRQSLFLSENGCFV